MRQAGLHRDEDNARPWPPAAPAVTSVGPVKATQMEGTGEVSLGNRQAAIAQGGPGQSLGSLAATWARAMQISQLRCFCPPIYAVE